jgi:hypothetical protein
MIFIYRNHLRNFLIFFEFGDFEGEATAEELIFL